MFEPETRSDFLRYWAVPVFLLVIAGIHMYRVYAHNQSSWGAGCGFGMFATVDYHDTRFFNCEITTGSQEKLTAFFRPEFNEQDLAARIVPSIFNVSRLANQLSDQQWYRVNIYRDPNFTECIETVACNDRHAQKYIQSTYRQLDVFTNSQPVNVDQIDLSLLGIKFDLASQKIKSHLISKVTLQRAQQTESNEGIRETVY